MARPVIQFDPTNGRISFPLLRTHVGRRPPFSPNGHSGAPWLGETGDAAPSGTGPSPWAGRNDGICPAGAPVRHFNVVALDGLRLQVTKAGAIDPNGKVFVLAHDVAGVLNGTKEIQPLAIRANIGDCVAVTLTSLQHDANDFAGYSKANIHIHHVQFDTQASDGVVTGMSYEQTVRPFQAEDPQITQDAAVGDTTLSLSSVTKFQAGEWIAAGLATESIEVRQIASIDAAAKTITLTKALEHAHAAGQYAGVEFVQYRWYPDVQLDNIFFHTHVDGIHDWGHGIVGQLIIEPKGSTYHDPQTGAEVDSGTIVDIHTNQDASDPRTQLAPGLVNGSFREMALWTIDDNPAVDSTLNLRAEPWADRLAQNGDSSLLFSSYAHGDPFTPLPMAYAGDPFVIRTINVSDGVDTLHVDGSRFFLENRFEDPDHPGERAARPLDTIHYGISERFSLIAKGGAGGPLAVPGDYLYMNAIGRRFRQGAWGIIRVLPGRTANLKPLPDRAAPASTFTLPAVTGGRPPEPADTGNPCPALAPQRSYDISAVDVPKSAFGNHLRAAFVPSNLATQVEKKAVVPEPLVLHVAAGTCITVHFSNRRTVRASFHSGLLSASANGNTAYGSASSGIDVGFGPEQTVAPGGTRDYRLYADTAKLGATLISDFGGATVAAGVGGVATNVDTGPTGMYGAIVVAPAGATFTEPKLGGQVSYGAQVDVHVPGAASYRDFTLLMQDEDEDIGQSHMPYPTEVNGHGADQLPPGPGQDQHERWRRRIRGDEQRVERHPGHAHPQGLRGRSGAGTRTRDARQRADARVQPRRRVVAERTVHRRLQPDAGPRDRPVGDHPGHGRRWGRRRRNRRRPVLRRPPAPVHRGGHVGHPARDVGRDLPDQAARQPRLHRQLGRVHHARRDRARNAHHPSHPGTPGTGRRRQAGGAGPHGSPHGAAAGARRAGDACARRSGRTVQARDPRRRPLQPEEGRHALQ